MSSSKILLTLTPPWNDKLFATINESLTVSAVESSDEIMFVIKLPVTLIESCTSSIDESEDEIVFTSIALFKANVTVSPDKVDVIEFPPANVSVSSAVVIVPVLEASSANVITAPLTCEFTYDFTPFVPVYLAPLT